MLMFLKEQSFTSYQTFAKSGTMFQPEPSRLRLSGLKSRAHLIRKYSFPSCQAQSSLHALSRLYVQKITERLRFCQIFTVRCGRQIPAAIGLCVWGQPLFPRDSRIFQYFSFSVLRQGVQAAHSVLHQRRHWMSAGDL